MKKTDNGQEAIRGKSEGPEVAILLGKEPHSRAPSSISEVQYLDVAQCGLISQGRLILMVFSEAVMSKPERSHFLSERTAIVKWTKGHTYRFHIENTSICR